MSRRFITPERDQLYLMPHNLEDWIPEDDIVHFVIEAAELVPVDDFRINDRGTGSRQYHPNMMLALLLYCYSHGIFSSRPIERAAYKDVAIRYLCGNTHPDHNTICLFRSRNEKANLIAKLQEREIDVILPLVSKEVPGFRNFHLRTLEKVNLEWNLMACAYNVKRLAKLV